MSQKPWFLKKSTQNQNIWLWPCLSTIVLATPLFQMYLDFMFMFLKWTAKDEEIIKHLNRRERFITRRFLLKLECIAIMYSLKYVNS